MNARQQLYEGKAKIIYATSNPDEVITFFKDDATAFNAAKRGTIEQKGVVNAKLTTLLFQRLAAVGIPTHFIRQVNERELLVQKVTIIPIEVVVRNLAAGSLCKRLGLEKGQKLQPPLVEFYYKNDSLQDPLITNAHVRLLKLATDTDLEQIEKLALTINQNLQAWFLKVGMQLADFKIEFGKTSSGKIVLADEISPDTCRLWDSTTGNTMDKDRFRFDMGDVAAVYQEVLKRMEGLV